MATLQGGGSRFHTCCDSLCVAMCDPEEDGVDLDFDDVDLQWLDMMSGTNVQAIIQDDESMSVQVSSSASVIVIPESAMPSVQAMTASNPDNQSKRSDTWTHVTNMVLDPIRKARGKQLKPVVIVASCAGIVSERPCLQKLQVETRFPWVVEKKASCYHFVEENGPARDHHFIDLTEVAQTGSGFCVKCQQVCAAVCDEEIDDNSCGFSCRPFSMAVFNRDAGTVDHPEGMLWHDWVADVKRTNPGEAWGENVTGIALRESKAVAKSPLQLIVEDCAVELPTMHLLVFFVNGSVAGAMCRRRIYVHLLSDRRGGAVAHQRMQNYYLVSFENRINRILAHHLVRDPSLCLLKLARQSCSRSKRGTSKPSSSCIRTTTRRCRTPSVPQPR